MKRLAVLVLFLGILARAEEATPFPGGMPFDMTALVPDGQESSRPDPVEPTVTSKTISIGRAPAVDEFKSGDPTVEDGVLEMARSGHTIFRTQGMSSNSRNILHVGR